MKITDKTYLQINQALFSLVHSYESRMAKENHRNVLGLRMSDCSVLMVMSRFAPLTSRRLSQLMGVNPGAVSLYVQHLVEKGLVRKEQDREDRRNWLLTLTETGRIAAQAVVAGAVEYTKDFMAGLAEEEQAQLGRLLLKASHALGFDWQ
ncbi:MAG: MarR family transcriptional regulator [Anaerolineales bacterium]|nr:MarR family transcriptional regulator [Anaerolineales bacterium]